MHVDLVTVIVDEYDPAIRFFVAVLGFELVEDSPSRTNDGRPKRWVVVRPPGGGTGLLLAQADGEAQSAAVGRQFAGHVGLFLRVDDFSAAYGRMVAAKVEFISPPRDEPYGTVAVFVDVAGNRWGLLAHVRPDERVPAPNGRARTPRRRAGRQASSWPPCTASAYSTSRAMPT